MLNARMMITVVCLLALPLSSAFSDVIMIDDMEGGLVDFARDGATSSPGGISRIDSGLTGVIGGRRMGILAYFSGPDFVTLRIDYVDTGVLGFSEGYDTEGRAGLVYGRMFQSEIDLNVDLTDGGTNGVLVITFLTADLAGTVKVDLETYGASAKSTWIGPTPSGVFNTPTDMIIPLFGPGWTDDTLPADRTNIDTITILLDGAPNGDYAIDEIYVDVPEPASLALLSIGALAMLKRRRKV